jgi:D-alanine-D-alanine ligase
MTTIVLFGGRSDERHVSVATAQNVTRIIGTPLCWFWSPEGAVYDVSRDELLAHQRPFEVDYRPARPAIWPTIEQALDTLPVEDPVFFLALHGGEGEDGTLQRLMEQRGIPFTGSGSQASAASFDKGTAKERVQGSVRTAESRIARKGADIERVVRDMLTRHERIVLKPLAGGSSRGLFFLDREGDLDSVLANAAALGVPYIVEQFIAGRELTVGVVDLGHGPVPLPLVEIEINAGFSFDYEGKYLGKGTREICPALVPQDVCNEAQRTAVTAHTTLGCEGYSRTDVIASGEGVYFLELNTLPGLTTSSLVPQELHAAGIDMREFIEKQLELAARRARSAVHAGMSLRT